MTRPILIRYTVPSPLLTPSTPQRILAAQQDRAMVESEIGIPQDPPISIEDRSSDSKTPICQVQPSLGMTPTENIQLRDRNQPEDIADVLGTTAFKGYVNTPIQTLNSIVVQQPKRFLPLAEEAKTFGRGNPHRKAKRAVGRDTTQKTFKSVFLGSTELFTNSRTIGTLGISQAASSRRHHRYTRKSLGKADNIPFNQLYYIMENCTDRYYSKVIVTFVSIIKRQFADRQTLLVNTAHSLKILEEYSDRQAQIWKIFHKHHNIPDDIVDLHLHFDSFKTILETEFKHLKEVTSRNIENIQMSLSIQQTYSSTLCSHINNIYSKLSELQKLIQHHCMSSHHSDSVQIEAPKFDPDIDRDSPAYTEEKHGKVSVQGTLATIPETSETEDEDSITLEPIQTNKITKKPVALTLPPCRY